MLPRCFIFFGVIALFAVIVNITAEESEEEDEDEESSRANPAVRIVAKIIGSLFTGAAISCLTEAATKCKSNWRSPRRAIRCARGFLAANKGRCATG